MKTKAMRSLLIGAICTSMPLTAFAEQPACTADGSLREMIADLTGEIGAIQRMSDDLDKRASRAIENCDECAGNAALVWSVGGTFAAGGAAFSAFGVWMDRDYKKKYDETLAKDYKGAGKEIKNRDLNMHSDNARAGRKFATAGAMLGISSVIVSAFFTKSYEKYNQVEIKGDSNTRYKLRNQGEDLVPSFTGPVISTAELLAAEKKQMQTFRTELNTKLSEHRYINDQKLSKLQGGSQPFTTALLQGMRREQILIQAAAMKLQEQREAVATLCLKMADVQDAQNKLAPPAADPKAVLR